MEKGDFGGVVLWAWETFEKFKNWTTVRGAVDV
jgi:hypothetical protein